MDPIVVASFLAVIGLVLVHLFAGKLHILEGIPRSRWLSMAGGVSVAYVFIHLLPELSEHQEVLSRAVDGPLGFLERHVYLLSLSGLAIFYGLDRLALKSRKRKPGEAEESSTSPGVFWLHIVSFGVYNALIGYLLLHREQSGLGSLIFFAVAMSLHFLVNDYGLREHHKEMYKHIGRWILVAAILAGWGIGLFAEVSEVVLAMLIAFLSGGIILNVLKEELPEERESRFSAFVLGVAAYTALLLAL